MDFSISFTVLLNFNLNWRNGNIELHVWGSLKLFRIEVGIFDHVIRVKNYIKIEN